MKIFRIGMFENPTTEKVIEKKTTNYAHFSALGTWVSKQPQCHACGWHWQEYGPPLLVQWEPSTEVIGDFSWDGPFGYLFVVKESIANSLRAMHFKCSFLPVEYVPPKPKKKAKCVPFPYFGPKLVWGLCQSFVDLDMKASKVTPMESCPVCGWLKYTFRYKGIFIRKRDWHGEKIFRITTNGNSFATFVTEEGREMMEGKRFTNIAFSEAGSIVK